MAKNALPMFYRDPRTSLMKQLAPDELGSSPLAGGKAGPGPVRVLVADDDESDRLLTIWQLGDAWPVKNGLLVECAADGEEALEKIRAHRYALVVLDWNMPRQDGAEVLRAMREHELRIPVVVLSDQRLEDIATALELMTAAFLNKGDLDTQSLRNAIAVSVLLQAGPDLVGPDLDTMRT